MSKKSFTIIELILVVAVVLALAAVAIVRYTNTLERARSAEAYSVLADIASAQSAYYVEFDAYATSWGALDRFDAAPVSQNFTFDVNVTSGYVTATHISGKGEVDYYMCVKGGVKGTSAPTCN